MKNKSRFCTKLCVIMLSVVLLFSILFSIPIDNSNTVTAEATRTIDTASLNDISFEEKTEQLLSQFDDYNSIIDNDGNMTFEGTIELDLSQVMTLNFVNTYDETIEKKYKTTINPENFDFTVIISYYQGDELLSSDELVTQPYYVEEVDDFYIDLKDETISLKEILVDDGLNECVAIVDDLAIAAAMAVTITVIALAPQISQVVTTAVTTVVSLVKSFWGWLKSLYVKTTITTTTTTIVKSYRINIFSKTLTLKKVENGKLTYDPNIYYVAVIVDQDVYISYQMITQDEAISLLAKNIYTVIESGSNKKYQLNTYTYLYDDAFTAAASVAIISKLGDCTWHSYHQYDKYGNKKKGTFFQHFHPGDENIYPGLAHSFYGIPVVNT